jgi:hypothetical protein
MDHFGIGAAIRAATMMYAQSARRTGRTTSLIESVKDGDRICFSSHQEARHVKALCADRGVRVECVVVSPSHPEQLLDLGTAQGRTLMDHSWVEQYYIAAIERAQAEIDQFEARLSGYGVAHRETRRRAIELAKWSV